MVKHKITISLEGSRARSFMGITLLSFILFRHEVHNSSLYIDGRNWWTFVPKHRDKRNYTWGPVESGSHVARVAVLPRAAAAASVVILDDDGVAKVAEPQLPPVAVDEEVGGLDVAVAHAVAAVEVLQGAEHLCRVQDGVLARQSAYFGGEGSFI